MTSTPHRNYPRPTLTDPADIEQVGLALDAIDGDVHNLYPTAWTALILTPPTEPFTGTDFAEPAVRKEGSTVHLRGVLRSATGTWSPITELGSMPDPMFVPASRLLVPALADNGANGPQAARLDLRPDGTMSVTVVNTSASWVSINCSYNV